MMADPFDQATHREEQERAFCIDLARRKQDELPAIGLCYFCGASVPAGHRFCDADCRTDHEREKAAAQRNGHPR